MAQKFKQGDRVMSLGTDGFSIRQGWLPKKIGTLGTVINATSTSVLVLWDKGVRKMGVGKTAWWVNSIHVSLATYDNYNLL